MVVISKTILSTFVKRHADAANALNIWWAVVKSRQWRSLADIRVDFRDVDYVGNDRYVFNIRGNRYRLIAMIFFDIRTVFIRFVGTHSEYDKIDSQTV